VSDPNANFTVTNPGGGTPGPSTTLSDTNNNNNPASGTAAPPSGSPYAKRIIQLTFGLAGGQFKGGGNSLTISGLRTFVTIQTASFPDAEQAIIRVYGMTLDHINTLTKAGTYYSTNLGNTVVVAAGDVGGPITTIFKGIINEATPTFTNQPDVSFMIQAYASLKPAMTKAAPVTFPGQVTVEQALTQVLKPIGATVKNNGVDVTLQSPYFPGGVWQQVARIVQAANCSAAYNGTDNVFTISPKFGGSASQSNPAIISPETGMIGYPEFEQLRIRVRTLFVPGILVRAESFIQVKSQLTAANGKWRAYDVVYNISAEVPGGPWEMIVTGIPDSAGGNKSPPGSAGAV
jgi:hypothetical protein